MHGATLEKRDDRSLIEDSDPRRCPSCSQQAAAVPLLDGVRRDVGQPGNIGPQERDAFVMVYPRHSQTIIHALSRQIGRPLLHFWSVTV